MPDTSLRLAVAIPCYNAAPWIERTINSVLVQNYPDLIVIVVDDGSSDGSADLVRDRFQDRVLLEAGPNRGACHARNRGLAIARDRGADYILFLDADDYVEGDMLAGAAAVAQARDADMVLSDMHVEYRDGRRDLRFHYSGHVTPRDLFFGWMHSRYINPSGILWRCSFVERIGRWDESLARAQDFDITLRATLHDPVIWKNDAGAAIHARVNGTSISADQSEKALRSRLRVVHGLLERIQEGAFADAAPLLCREIYHIARAGFRNGQTALGREAMAILSREGHRDHHGTPTHRIAARIFGLERKVRLTKG